MATITFYLGKLADNQLVGYPNAEFDRHYEPEWLESPLGRRIIKGIDDTDVLSGKILESRYLGVFAPKELSCGCKSVLLAAFCPEAYSRYFDGSKMGDNCYPWLFEVARETGNPVKVQVGRLLRDDWGEDGTVMFLPRNEIVKGYQACFSYLCLHVNMFYKGDGYGTQG